MGRHRKHSEEVRFIIATIEGRSVADIGAEYGISPSTVCNYRAEFGIDHSIVNPDKPNYAKKKLCSERTHAGIKLMMGDCYDEYHHIAKAATIRLTIKK